MDIRLVLDSREARLIQILTELKIPIEIENLEIGDVNIISPDFTLIFERKAGSDLESSIKDGRYSEQKSRMLSTAFKCTYILENTNTDTEAKRSAVIHTMYRDNMHVVFTRDTSDTAGFIKDVYQRCQVHPEYFSGTITKQEYIDSVKVKTKKSDNIDIPTCWILQLSQIPGISVTIAKSISQVYPTMGILVDALRNSENKVKLLSGIDKIAVKKATKIIEYLQL